MSALFVAAAPWCSARQAAPIAPAQAATPRAPDAAITVKRAPSTAANRRKGAIHGRVVDGSGQPLPQATVYVRAAGDSFGGPPRFAQTDAEGQFHLDNLPAAAYTVNASAPGFTSQRSANFGDVYYHLGDFVTLSMVKGGVITGRVTKVNGDPAVAVPVSASLMRDPQGRPPRASAWRYASVRHTDDRGDYRIFGLPPGTYVVSVNYGQQNYNPYGSEDAVPTYHPSATRDTAAELAVREGQELGGVDIQLRGERGHAVSGSISGGFVPNSMYGGSMVSLFHVGTRIAEATTYVDAIEGEDRSFEFDGVPDGEYEVVAQSGGYGREDLMASAPRRIIVKGGDLTGVNLQVGPLGSIAGRVVFERTAAALDPARAAPTTTTTAAGKCAVGPEMSTSEIVVRSRRAEKGAAPASSLSRPFPAESVVNDQGEFVLRSLEAGRYRLEITPPGNNWYVRAISASSASRNAVRNTARPSGAAAVDSLELDVRTGQRLRDVAITITEGAASLRGRVVVAAAQDAAIATSPPSELLVHLIPIERTEADNALRYSQTEVKPNGEFSMTNIAPGRYWLLADGSASADAASPDPSRLAAWDAESRARLRRAAESANVVVEMGACQSVVDYELRFPAASVQPAATREMK